MQDERAGEAALGPDRLAHEIGGVLGAFALVDLPADDLAAEDVEDQVEVEEHAPDRAGHPGVSRPEELHLRPLSEPDVNLSAHPAPIIQPTTDTPATNERSHPAAFAPSA